MSWVWTFYMWYRWGRVKFRALSYNPYTPVYPRRGLFGFADSMRKQIHPRKGEKGQSLTELAISFLALVMILAVAIDAGRAFLAARLGDVPWLADTLRVAASLRTTLRIAEVAALLPDAALSRGAHGAGAIRANA